MALLIGSCGPAHVGPAIRLLPGPGDGTGAVFVVDGLPPEAVPPLADIDDGGLDLFAVYVDQPGARQEPLAVLGSYRFVGTSLRFEPRYPLERGVSYRARLDLSPWAGGPSFVEESFSIPAADMTPTATVLGVYPSTALLPENQLKFYLHFSDPMSRGMAYEHIRLLDADGKAVAAPFLVLDEELWDYEGKRFTLFFDPARIKRELRPHEELGRALKEATSYSLFIDGAWLDAEGRPLKSSFRKEFRVGPPDYRPIDPREWRIEAPRAGSRRPLRLRFPESLDRALLDRLVWIEEATGRKLEGRIDIGDEERHWTFTPDAPWRVGRYQLTIATILEDLAGNQVGKPFEVDIFERVDDAETKEADVVRLPFVVRRSLK